MADKFNMFTLELKQLEFHADVQLGNNAFRKGESIGVVELVDGFNNIIYVYIMFNKDKTQSTPTFVRIYNWDNDDSTSYLDKVLSLGTITTRLPPTVFNASPEIYINNIEYFIEIMQQKDA